MAAASPDVIRPSSGISAIKAAVTVDGEVVIPIDVEAFGFWLKAAFGQPTTACTTPKTTLSNRATGRCPACRLKPLCPACPAMRCIPAES